MKSLAKKILRVTGFYPIAQLCKEFVARPAATASDLRTLKVLRRQTEILRRAVPMDTDKRVLIMGFGNVSFVGLHAVVIGAFQVAGYEPVVLLSGRTLIVEEAYKALGVRRFAFLVEGEKNEDLELAARLMSEAGSTNQFLALTYKECRVGQAALSGLMRELRIGSPNLMDPLVRLAGQHHLSKGVHAAERLNQLFDEFKPDAVVVTDRYTPYAQVFDLAIARSVPVINLNSGHRDNILMFKRYSTANRDDHPFSLSTTTWKNIQEMPWTEEKESAVLDELSDCYRSGEWFSEVGTQFNKELFNRDVIFEQLGLDPNRKTAVIFPHIFWDGTFFWGKDIFESYEEWFVKTVTYATNNPNLNWVIKVHPANLVKDARDGYSGTHNELRVLYEKVGGIAAHIHVLPADSPISTLSLFEVTNYCLTVRGTPGIEAACFGIPVVTAGTGRYDHKGFTIDPRDERGYHSVIEHLHDIAGLSDHQIELARRFAYGALLCRPLRLESIRMSYEKDAKATLRVMVKARSSGEFFACADVQTLATWLESSEEDLIAVPPSDKYEATASRKRQLGAG